MINTFVIKNKKQYFIQCLVPGILILIILFSLASVLRMDILGAIGASSLASSIVLIFMVPHSPMSKAKNVLGGYILGMVIGISCYYMGALLRIFIPEISLTYDSIIFCSIAVVLTQLLMVLFNVEHAPAAGLAIGLVLEEWEFTSILIILISVACLTLIKYFLRQKLVNLT